MRDTTKKKYLDICAAKIATNATAEQLAEQFNCGTRSVELALHWGEVNNYFVQGVKEKIDVYLAEYRELLDPQETIFFDLCKSPQSKKRKGKRKRRIQYPVAQITALSRSILDIRDKIINLEGLKSGTSESGKIPAQINIQIIGKVEKYETDQ